MKKALLGILIISLCLIGCDLFNGGTSPEKALVTKIVDGDTIWVEMQGQTYKVRYIGVDTPETYGEDECYGQEAKEKNRELVDGKVVYLEYDIDLYDPYDRLLAYVWLTEEHNAMVFMVNYALVEEGYARVMTITPNIEYADRFEAAEEYAQWNNLGLWKECQ